MLTELYQYALDKGLAARPGFKKKNVKAYVLLSQSGSFIGITVREKGAEQIYAPDIGSAAQGTQFCNLLIEKAKYPLGITTGAKDKEAVVILTKRGNYLSALEDGASAEPLFKVLKVALEQETVILQILASMAQHRLKGDDVIGFQIDGFPLERSEAFADWWMDYRDRYTNGSRKDDVVPRCMITGELLPAMKTVPKVSGLLSVGGHSSGDAFLCFDKDAFQSYGLKQSANAPVSEAAMTAVNSALTELIREAPTLGGAKIVHWYSGERDQKEDPVRWALDPESILDESDLEEEEEEEEEEEQGERERAALREAGELLSSVHRGHNAACLTSRYYIMPLSGVNGRMMIRGWYEGDFGELQRNIRLWFDDLSLITWDGRGMAKNPKLVTLYIRLLKPGGDGKVFDRMGQELSGLSVRILYSVIKGLPLPDDVPLRVIRWINSGMLTGDKTGDGSARGNAMEHEMPAFQLLKAWLRRSQRQKGEKDLMEAQENPNVCRDTAYYCGQLMAIYAAIQKSAMPEVGTTLAQRYYTSASTNPAFVIGRLSQLSQHHLAKLEGGLPVYYERMLAEVYGKIGDREIPVALNASQQSEFALGYYQKRAQLYGGAGTKNADSPVGEKEEG